MENVTIKHADFTQASLGSVDRFHSQAELDKVVHWLTADWAVVKRSNAWPGSEAPATVK